MNWLIPANANLYNYDRAFNKNGFIDWKQGNRKYRVGDYVYIYCTKPVQKIMYKAEVVAIDLEGNQILDDSEFWYDIKNYIQSLAGKFIKLSLIKQIDCVELNLENLLNNGLNSAPQSPIKISETLMAYIDRYMRIEDYSNIFPDSAETETCIEGAKTTVLVNKYERNTTARQKCIAKLGCYCHICGINFEKVYGEIGKDFIHVHHKIPLNEIKEEYVVNPIKDLLPICPNCHAMLHRKINDKYLTIEELKQLFSK